MSCKLSALQFFDLGVKSILGNVGNHFLKVKQTKQGKGGKVN